MVSIKFWNNLKVFVGVKQNFNDQLTRHSRNLPRRGSTRLRECQDVRRLRFWEGVMLEDVIRFYEKDLSSFKLVFSEIKGVWYLFVMASIGITVLLGISGYLHWPEVNKLVFAAACYSLLFLYTNHSAKKVLKRKYNITPEDFLWAGTAYNKMRLMLLKNYLNERNLLTKEKLELIIELLYKRSDNTKQSGLIGVGLFLALFIPVWSQFVGSLYRNSFPLDQALTLLGIIIVVLVIVIGFLKMIQSVILDFTARKRETMRNVATLLEEILLTF